MNDDMTTTARLRLAHARTARAMPSAIKTDPGMPATRPPGPVLDVSAVSNGCLFCDDAGCSDCTARPSLRISAVGTIAPVDEIGDDDETIISTSGGES